MARQLKICMLGGTGFVGHHITAEFAELGHRITILTRHYQRNRDLLVWPSVGLREGDIYDPEFLKTHFRGMDAVINLVGILNERGRRGKGFERAHVDLLLSIEEAIQATGTPRLLHMSALNATLDAPSFYLQTKARGEQIAHRIPGCAVTSFRPSVIFGEDDSFTRRFAGLLKALPWLFPLAKPEARMQPIHVDDVARCFAQALTRHASFGQTYNLGGPNIYTLYEIVQFIDQVIQTRRRIVPLSDWQSQLQARVMERLPGKPFSIDNLRSLEVDNICREPCPLPFDIQPRSMESEVPVYLRPEDDTLNRIRNAPPGSRVNPSAG